jgi:hypothetical protein
MEQTLQDIIARCLPPPTVDRMTGVHDTPRPVVLMGPGYAGAAVWDRLLSDRRRVAAVAATAFVIVSLAVFGISRARPRSRPERASVASAGAGKSSPASSSPGATIGGAADPSHASRVAAPTAPPEAPAAVAPVEVVVPPIAAASTDGAETPARVAPVPAAGLAKARPAVAPGLSPAEARKLLDDAEGLLRAQRFNEASAIFSRLAKNKSTRGRALVALAEIAFQERNYEETIRSAKLASERGGGARAQVLLGDAHFRLSHYPAAVTAYEQALRLEPGNPSARSGLALASKRM